MKKILTILAATATTLFAFGAINGDTVINQGADFEAFTAGNAFSAGLNDSAQESTPFYWYTADTDAANIISNYTGSGTEVPIASRPDKFAEASNSKYLQVETTGKLYRTVKNNGGSDDFTTNVTATYAHSLTDAPIYLDTLVKFTAADSVFGPDALENGDKIAIEYVEHESEGGDDPAVTNFVVRAGLIAGEVLSQTNYFVAVPVGFDKDAWHRLTVRTIPEVGTTENPGGVGFVIYLDETNLTYSASVDAGFGTLNATAQGFYNTTKHALFPSAIPADGTGGKTISAAAFSGNGSLDDVVFTTTTPEFVASGETPKVTVTWDTNVVSGITIAGNEITGADFEAGSKLVDLVGTTLAVVATPVTNYELVYDPTYENGAFTGLSAGDNCTITGFIPLFDVGGTHYKTATEAISAAVAAGTSASPATIRLLADINESIVINSGYVVIDLAGKTITGDDIAGGAIVNNGATLKIINSTEDIGHVVPNGEDYYAVLIAGGSTEITGGSFDGAIEFDADEFAFAVNGGVFLDTKAAGDTSKFYLKAYAGANTLNPLTGNYIQVGGGSGPTPIEIAVPTAATGLVYDGTQKTGVAEGTGYTLSGDYEATNAGNYTATATLTSGYVWNDGTSDPTNITWSIAAKTDATVVVALTADIAEYTAQLEFPTATATIGDVAVAGNTAWAPATISEPEAGATNTYTVTFTVTTPNYAGSTGTATFKVYKAAGGGSEDWPENPSTVSGQTAQAAFGITGDLANADAAALATWAKAKGVTYADRTTAILTDAFLLDCANTQEAIATAAANFKITSITVAGDTVTIAPAAGDVYGNGQVAIEGATSLASPISWHEKQAGDHFFKATLVVKPVAVP